MWSASRSGRFSSGKETPTTTWTGDSVGPAASLDILEKGGIVWTLPGIETRTVQPVAQLVYGRSYYRLLTANKFHETA
jgi:hypothetical protein